MVILAVLQKILRTRIEVMIMKLGRRKENESYQSYESYPSKVKRDLRKFSKDVEVLSNKECVNQHIPLVCNFVMRKVVKIKHGKTLEPSGFNNVINSTISKRNSN